MMNSLTLATSLANVDPGPVLCRTIPLRSGSPANGSGLVYWDNGRMLRWTRMQTRASG